MNKYITTKPCEMYKLPTMLSENTDKGTKYRQGH